MTPWRRWPLALFSLLAAGCAPSLTSSDGPSDGSTPAGPPPSGALQVTFVDVGQGDAALVQSGGASLLIDGGPSGAGPRVLDALKQAGVRKLDWVLGSHPHEDHIGGLIDVLRGMPAARALDPGYNHGTATQKTYLGLLKSGGVKTTRARAGQTYDIGSARLEILAPEEPLLAGTDSDPNNNSIVCRLVFGQTRFLFTGDMEEDGRARLLRAASPAALQADVLKVAHHGSHNGTDAEFLRAVRPRYGVISLARGNDYGHPHREAVQALNSAGVQILRTDERGTIVFTSDGKTLKVGAGAQAKSPAAPSRVQRVVGNRTSQVYHAPDCGRLPGRDNRAEFASATAAEAAGYRPHQACSR